MARARIANAIGSGWFNWSMSHCPTSQALVTAAKSRADAAVAWAIKYLVAASVARGWWDETIRGRIARVLISSPIHARNQWELANVIVVPRPSMERNVAKM